MLRLKDSSFIGMFSSTGEVAPAAILRKVF
jgi:hypothetical protein